MSCARVRRPYVGGGEAVPARSRCSQSEERPTISRARFLSLKAALGGSAAALLLACAPSSPCRSGDKVRQLARYSKPYAGHWIVTHGDTLTLPDTTLGDRFKLTDIVLDTDTVSVAKECLYRGRLTFAVPAETIAVTWYGVPERVTIIGWPPALGPFGGLDASWWGRDSLRGAVLFDERLGIRVRPGATAQFWAGRAKTQ